MDADTEWDIDGVWELEDPFNDELFFWVRHGSGRDLGNCLVMLWKWFHPDQKIIYFNNIKHLNPNFGLPDLKLNKSISKDKVIPVSLPSNMENPEVVLQL